MNTYRYFFAGFSTVKNLLADRHLYLHFEVSIACDFVISVLSEDNGNDSEVAQEINDNRAEIKDNRLERKFVNENVTNLSQRQLTKSVISFLSNGRKFVPTPNRIYKTKHDDKLRTNLKTSWGFLETTYINVAFLKR